MTDARSRLRTLAQSPAFVVAVAVAVRVLVWALGLANPESFRGGDTPDYWSLAEQPLSTYRVTSGEMYDAGLRRPPGYPVVLALFRMISNDVAVVALLQTTFAILVVVLIVTLGRALLGVRAALVAGWWLALDPQQIVESSVLMTEIPFSLAILLATFAAAKALGAPRAALVWWAACGGLLGWATLVRPIAYYLPVVLCPIVVLGLRSRLGWRPALASAGAVLGTFLLLVAPWVARNAIVSGVPTISTIQGVNMAHYRAAGALADGTGLPLQTARQQVRSAVDARLPAGANRAVRSRVEEQVAVELILENPVGYTISAIKGAARTLLGPGGAAIRARMGSLPGGGGLFGLFWALSAASALAASVLTFAGLAVLAVRRNWQLFALLALPTVYLLIVGSGLESYSRFRLQMLPSMIAAASVAVIALRDMAQARFRVHSPMARVAEPNHG